MYKLKEIVALIILITSWWAGLQTLWRFWLKDLPIDEMVGPDALAVCLAHRGLPIGFLLLRYSVLFTVESFSLLYLLVISWFICSRRWCIDKLGVFNLSCSTWELSLRLARCETSSGPPVRYFTDRSEAVLLLWIFYVYLSRCCYAFVHDSLYVPCGHLLGKGWPLGSRLWCLTVSLSLFHWYPWSDVVLVSISDLCTLTLSKAICSHPCS